MKSINERLTKVKQLKEAAKILRDEIATTIANVDIEADSKLPAEELKTKKAKLKDEIQIKKTRIQELMEEAKIVHMNRTGSKFFEWHPNKGMNRSQARQFRKQRRLGGL